MDLLKQRGKSGYRPAPWYKKGAHKNSSQKPKEWDSRLVTGRMWRFKNKLNILITYFFIFCLKAPFIVANIAESIIGIILLLLFVFFFFKCDLVVWLLSPVYAGGIFWQIQGMNMKSHIFLAIGFAEILAFLRIGLL